MMAYFSSEAPASPAGDDDTDVRAPDPMPSLTSEKTSLNVPSILKLRSLKMKKHARLPSVSKATWADDVTLPSSMRCMTVYCGAVAFLCV